MIGRYPPTWRVSSTFRVARFSGLEETMLGLTRTLKGEKDFSELLQRLEYGGCPLVYSGL